MNRREFHRRGAAALFGSPLIHTFTRRFDYPWNLGIITDQVDLNLSRVLNGFYRKFQLRWAEMDDLKRAADAAHTLGTQRIRIFSFRRVAKPAAIFDRMLEQLQTAIVVAKQQDVILLVENEYDCNTATGAEIAKLFEAIPDRRLMHYWDPCNAYVMGEKPFPKVWDQLDHGRISHIHLKDASGKEWKPIGAGQIDFGGQFRALKAMKYSGTLSVETRYADARQDQYASSVESMNGLVNILRRI